MIRTSTLLVLLLLLSLTAVAQPPKANVQTPVPASGTDHDAAQWKSFTTPDGTVATLMPGVPNTTRDAIDTAEGRFAAESHALATDFGQYGIALVDLPNRSTHPDFIRGFFDGFRREKLVDGARLLNENELTGFPTPGREYVITDEGAVGRYWVFHSSGRMYTLWLLTKLEVTFRDGKPSSERSKRSEAYETISQRFFGSLKLNPKSDARIPVKEANDELLPPVSGKRDLYPTNVDAAKQIEAAVKTAAAESRRVMLIFGGNWCYDCHVLDQALHEGEAGRIVKESFLLVHVDIGEGDKNLDIVKKYEATLDFGVPVVVILDGAARVVYSSTKGEFEAARRMMKKDLVAFLNQWKVAPR